MKELLGLGVLAWPLVLLVAILVAFAVVISLAVAYAARSGKSKWRWGILGFLVVYLPIFWDWIPTVVAHKYYCSTEAGFWVYKTPEQWKKENPGVMETLVYDNKETSSRQGDMMNYTDTYVFNGRLNYVSKKNGPFFLYRWKWERQLVDTKTGEVLGRYVDFSNGNGFITSQDVPLKFWIQSGYCSGGRDRAIESGNWMNQFKGSEK